MKRITPTENFLFIGYQLRKVQPQVFCGSLADNVNPLYILTDEQHRRRYDAFLSRLRLPFFCESTDALIDLCRVVFDEERKNDETVRVFTCNLFQGDARNASCEFFDSEGKLTALSYQADQHHSEPILECELLGLDVLDASQGGGFDSAIHTYGFGKNELNPNGLITDLRVALKIRSAANERIEGHGPFTIWKVGMLPHLSEIVQS